MGGLGYPDCVETILFSTLIFGRRTVRVKQDGVEWLRVEEIEFIRVLPNTRSDLVFDEIK